MRNTVIVIAVAMSIIVTLLAVRVVESRQAPKPSIDRVQQPILFRAPMEVNNRKVLTQIADNIVAHIEADPDRLRNGHAERLLLVEMVENILIGSLHAEGYVRLEPIVVKP